MSSPMELDRSDSSMSYEIPSMRDSVKRKKPRSMISRFPDFCVRLSKFSSLAFKSVVPRRGSFGKNS